MTGSGSGGDGGRRREIVKICGVTRPQDAALAVELGADLIGLNFYPPSPRYLDPDRDGALVAKIASASEGVQLVGVFVDEEPERIEEIAGQAGLDLVQLHGHEGPELAARFGRRAIKVFRRDALPEPEELAAYAEAWGFLFDVPARAGRDPGGTGTSWEYEMLAALASDRPVLVAGGIRPGNARRALEASGADGVDVCSGIEVAPGVKDPEQMRRLFEEVRHGTP